jgi:SAM-dependent methyltransferase
MAAPVGPSTHVLSVARRIAGARQLGQLVRMAPVLEAIRDLGGGTLLDVGSGGLGIADFLDDRWRVTALDRSFGDYGAWVRPPRTNATRVLGDVRSLPFDDDAFDVVVALDLLEHVGPADRARALEELSRVARRRVIVAAPAGPEALAADRLLAASLRRPPPWLTEHLDNGLPLPDDLVDPLRRRGAVRVFGNERAASHVTLTRRELSLAWYIPTRLSARMLAVGLRRQRPWAGTVLRRLSGHDRPPVYRTVVVAEIAASTSASSSTANAA